MSVQVCVSLRQKKLVATQAAMMDGEEGTTKYAEGPKFVVKILTSFQMDTSSNWIRQSGGGLKSKFSTSTKGGKVKLPSAFPEKGLYMLATILKSPQAVQAKIESLITNTRPAGSKKLRGSTRPLIPMR